MSNSPVVEDPGSVWRSLPEEEELVMRDDDFARRARDLEARTSADGLGSIAAGLLVLILVAWRLDVAHSRALQMALAAAVGWIAMSAYVLRRRKRHLDASSTCLEYYRGQLRERKTHLRSYWLLHGPLGLALVVLLVISTQMSAIVYRSLWSALPGIVLLGVWLAFSSWRRHGEMREVERELRETARLICLAIGILACVIWTPAAMAQHPPMRAGVSVQMPVTANAAVMADADEPDSQVFAVTFGNRVYLGITPMNPGYVQPTPGKRIYIKGDARVTYASIGELLQSLQTAGVREAVFLTSQNETPAPGAILVPRGIEFRIGESDASEGYRSTVTIRPDTRMAFGELVHLMDVCRASGAVVYLAVPRR